MLLSVFHLPNFRWLWLGQTFIYCASHFWLVSLTWLVLQKTNSGVALGMTLMAAAIPRALFMLIGGAMSDRLPTKMVATFAALINAILIGSIALSSFVDIFYLPAIVLIAALFGCAEAFIYPALLSLLPQIVNKSRLGEGNAWMQGSEQITNAIAPAAAGIAIGTMGLPISFTFSTVLFIMGSALLSLLAIRRRSPIKKSNSATLIGEIVEGLSYDWNKPAIRVALLLIAAINFAMLGPIVIGVAELVTIRFGGSATTFGYLQAAYGIGALLGVFCASRANAIKNLRTPLIALSYIMSVGLIILGFSQQVWLAAATIAFMGIGGGAIAVLALTWLQQQTIASMQGRTIALVMFASVALDPLSQAFSGMLLDIDLTGLFLSAGIIMFATAAISSLGAKKMQ